MKIFVIFVATLFLGCFQLTQAQDTRRLLQEWVYGVQLPSGVVSLQTLKRATKFDNSEDNVNLSFLDLNGDGNKELAIQSECAPVGNCQLDLYERSRYHYRKILATDIVQTIEVLPTGRRKYHDLKLGTHDTAFDIYYRVFRYERAGYRQLRCWEENFSYVDKTGALVELKRPIVKRGCQ